MSVILPGELEREPEHALEICEEVEQVLKVIDDDLLDFISILSNYGYISRDHRIYWSKHDDVRRELEKAGLRTDRVGRAILIRRLRHLWFRLEVNKCLRAKGEIHLDKDTCEWIPERQKRR